MKNFIKNYMNESINIKKEILNDEFIQNLELISKKIVECYRNGGKVLLAGNGGSAGDAQHIAGELINKFFFDRPGLPCIALTTDTSVLTAVGNDYLFEKVFSKQIEANGKPGDVFIGISTSGNSKNIVNAMQYCKENNITNIAFIGNNSNCKMKELCDYSIEIPSSITPHVQEGHIVCYHIICAIVEECMFGTKFN